MSKENIETRDRYPHFLSIQTRWSDNDIYGHVNNVTYYSYFDTVLNCFLIDQGVAFPYLILTLFGLLLLAILNSQRLGSVPPATA